jgi:hypothetical protein
VAFSSLLGGASTHSITVAFLCFCDTGVAFSSLLGGAFML